MKLNPSNSNNFEQLALKGLKMAIRHSAIDANVRRLTTDVSLIFFLSSPSQRSSIRHANNRSGAEAFSEIRTQRTFPVGAGKSAVLLCAVLAIAFLSVRLSVCLSHTGIVSKVMNAG